MLRAYASHQGKATSDEALNLDLGDLLHPSRCVAIISAVLAGFFAAFPDGRSTSTKVGRRPGDPGSATATPSGHNNLGSDRVDL